MRIPTTLLLASLLASATVSLSQTGSRSVEARITAQRRTVFVHETVTLDLTITSRGVTLGSNLELMSMPSEDVLRHGPFQKFRPERKQEGNQVIETRRFRCEARISKPGPLTLSPSLRVGIVERRRGFFGGSTKVEVLRTVRVHPLELTVRELPAEGRPSGFSGAVGRFSFRVDLDPTDLALGELVTATMSIRGIGYLENITAPQIPALPDIRTYEPRQAPNDGTSTGVTFTQVLVPQTTNAVTVPPTTFCYFDTGRGSYQTLTEGPFSLKYHDKKQAGFEPYRPEAAGGEESAGTAPVAATRRKTLNREALSTLALAGYWIAAAAATLWLAGRRGKEATRKQHATAGALCVLAALLLFVPCRLAVRHGLRVGQTASLSEDVIVRFAPSHGSLESFRLARDSAVLVLERHGGWSKIASGTRRGWVPAGHVTRHDADGAAP
jgi:hypothetical protein